MVEFVDGSMLAQLSEPSMTVPIQYALTYPKRLPSAHPPFDFWKNSSLQFLQPDKKKFRCLQLAYDALDVGGSMPCYMNAANEVLVNAFIRGELSWQRIATTLEELMQRHIVQSIDSLEAILSIDSLARLQALDAIFAPKLN